MGLNAQWFAVTGLDRAEVLDRLGLAETEKEVDFVGAAYSAAQLPTGWTVVFLNKGDWVTPARMAALSRGGRLLACSQVETVNYSAAYGYADGAEQWSVLRNPEEAEDDLIVSGAPPPEFGPLAKAARREQAEDADTDRLFETPAELIGAICGFNPDTASDEVRFRALRKGRAGSGAKAGSTSWLSRLFGR